MTQHKEIDSLIEAAATMLRIGGRTFKSSSDSVGKNPNEKQYSANTEDSSGALAHIQETLKQLKQ